MGNKYTLKEANEKLQTIFPNLSIQEYTNGKTLTKVTSSTCGHTWLGSFSNIMSKIGGHICRECYPPKNAKRTLVQVNELVHNRYPDIDIIKYNGSDSLATVKSNICGHTWENRPRNILSGHSGYICRVCSPAVNSVLTLEAANARIKSLDSNLVFISYKGLQIPSQIKNTICGHIWDTTLNNITTGNTPTTCPVCNPRIDGISRKEKEVLQFIKDNYNGWIIENDRLNIAPLELDIVLPDLGLAFEYNGMYWHRDKKNYHLDKILALKENMDYQLIHINSDEWNTKQNIVKSRILSLLNKTIKIYARNCVVREISFPRDFLDANHLQGAGAPTSTNLGLFHNDTLVSVMTFSKPRFNTKYDHELVRFCTILNTTVVGGASKLFKHFNKTSVISYSDKRWSSGNLYKKLGFEFLHTSEPNYRYYKGDVSLSRYQCQKHLLKERFPKFYADSKTEPEIMQDAGYYRVFDCGNDVWIYK